MRKLLIGTMIAAALAVGLPAHASETSCGFPRASWVARAPAKLGLSAPKLYDALDFATQHRSERGLLVRHGCRPGASRLDAVTGMVQLDGWSMTKTVTALLVGRAV